MNILIATGVYPPDIGGPATYAKNIEDVWRGQGHDVVIATYNWERRLPPGFRHIAYLFKILVKGAGSDVVLVLDTLSVAVPTMWACSVLRKEYIIRTGGDFLWESYLNRTRESVLLRDFYQTALHKLNGKERLIFSLTEKVLKSAKIVIFSTKWQRDIFLNPYKLNLDKTAVVENCYSKGGDHLTLKPKRVFQGGVRRTGFKNLDLLTKAFNVAQLKVRAMGQEDIFLDTEQYPQKIFHQKVKESWAVILVSLGDISPNTILEAIRYGVPCIITQENGLADRISEYVVSVDPLDEEDIVEKIVWISDPKNRAIAAEKVSHFSFVHTWEEIAKEIISAWKRAR